MEEKIKLNLSKLTWVASSWLPTSEWTDINISKTSEDISLQKDIKAWLDEVNIMLSEENSDLGDDITEKPEIHLLEKEPNDLEAHKETHAHISEENSERPISKSENIRRHNISLGSIASKSRKAKMAKEEERMEAEKAQEALEKNTPAVAAQEIQNAEEKELFWNYESKFSSESKDILQKLRMPRTRLWFVFSLIFLTVGMIWVLMMIDPKTHSISNYKASIHEIYKDITSEEQIDSLTTNTTTTQQEKTPEIEIITEKIPPISIEKNENKVVWKEQIKEENLRNFLEKNYK